jgi:hypothetical protein
MNTARGLQRIEKLAEDLDISAASVRRAIERGEIRGVRVGKIFLAPADESDRLRRLADANLRPNQKKAHAAIPEAAAAAGEASPPPSASIRQRK